MAAWKKIGGAGGGGIQRVVKEYTGAADNFTVPDNVYLLWVYAIGGGSGGSGRGGAGASGGVLIGAPILAFPGEVIPITVGNASPGSATGENGTAGESTTVAGWVCGGGGAAGSGGGSGGIAPAVGVLTGLWAANGVDGADAAGANSPFPGSIGGAEGTASPLTPGGDASGWGAGGGAPFINDAAGGDGSPGVVIIEYLVSQAP